MSNSIEDLEAQIAALEKKIADEPKRLRQEQERKRLAEEERLATMPPSDEVITQRREKMHKVEMTRGEASNARMDQAKDGILLILLIAAIGMMGFWLYSALQAV